MDTARQEDLGRVPAESVEAEEAQRVLDIVRSGVAQRPLTQPSFVNLITQLSLEEQTDLRKLFGHWLALHDAELEAYRKILVEVFHTYNLRKKAVRERVESSDYIRLVKRSLSRWSIADVEIKRTCLKNLLANAAVLTLSPDKTIELFIDWLDEFPEDYFQALQVVHESPGVTRKDIWLSFNDALPSEDSAAADMYRLLIHTLSTNHLIRQPRDKDYQGLFLKKQVVKKNEVSASSGVITSAFDDDKGYVVTELGKQFVRYTLHDQHFIESNPD